MSKYSTVIIFTKRDNMRKFCTEKVLAPCMSALHRQRMVEMYSHEREVQLIAMFRWEDGRCFCKIKCPINPLPIKGEFETPGTTTPVIDFLKASGWTINQKLYTGMFE